MEFQARIHDGGAHPLVPRGVVLNRYVALDRWTALQDGARAAAAPPFEAMANAKRVERRQQLREFSGAHVGLEHAASMRVR